MASTEPVAERAVRERPILFSGPMVRAIFEGRKTQIRRVMPPLKHPGWTGYMMAREGYAIENGPDYPDDKEDHVRCPYGVVGDRLWVRETFAVHSFGPEPTVHFRADDNNQYFAGKWKPAIFMPRLLSRILLEVVEVRAQRLQEISEEDAGAEGANSDTGLECSDCDWLGWEDSPGVRRAGPDDDWSFTCPKCAEPAAHHPLDEQNRMEFRKRWDSINGKSQPWTTNPWVWAVSFKRIAPRE